MDPALCGLNLGHPWPSGNAFLSHSEDGPSGRFNPLVACNRHSASEGAQYPCESVESASSVVYPALANGFVLELIDHGLRGFDRFTRNYFLLITYDRLLD